jgi:hypothetical protein
MTTKRELIDLAFETLGIASFAYDIQPEQMESARRKLNSMMAQWNARGIRLGFPIPAAIDGDDLDQETNLPDAALEATYLNLAKRIAPGFGKQLTPETKAMAREAFDAMMVRAVAPIEMQMPAGVPLGAGVRTYYGRAAFTSEPTDPLMAGTDSPLEF